MRETETRKRIPIKAKIEDLEAKVRKLEKKQTFKEYVVEKDKEYWDTAFWIEENSKNTTIDEVKGLTIKEVRELTNRLIQKIDAENRRNKRSE